MTRLTNPPEFATPPADPVGHSRLLPPPGTHSAHFYSSDDLLIAEISQRLGSTLAAGGSAVVIATPAHRQGFEKQLVARGLDLIRIAQQGRWLSVDAESTLAKFMVEGWPDTKRFATIIGGIIDRLTVAAGVTDAPLVTAYGEMVSILWEEGKTGAALRLEELWNDLALTRAFHLSCGWPLRFFLRDTDGVVIQRICAEHNQIVPGQGYDSMSEDERRRSAVLWQLKAQALEEETSQSRKTQQTLELRESELRDFLENAAIGMHWLAPDGTILWANRSELALLGYQSQQYIGHDFSEFAGDPGAVSMMLGRLRDRESIRGFELRLRASDGSMRWVRIDANPWLHNGELLHARCFALDIGEKKRADEAQMKLGAIVESSTDAIVSKDLNGIITSWNGAAEQILGYKADEIIGKPITTVIPPEMHGDETEILRKIQAGERIEHFETVRVTKSGERINVSLTISPVRDPQGKVIGAAKILRDVTMQKKLENALHTTERLASVGRLAATVAHEINNPLEAVTNLIYLARQDPDLPESARACLIMADEELQRVSHIARQTLGFYRDTSAPVWIDVPEAIDEMLAIYHRRLCYKQLELRKRTTPGLKLRALHGEFKQIVSNLITNAIDASPLGRVIEVRARQAIHPFTGAPGVQLVVADQGVGIPESIRRQIFAPFFTTKKDVGTGLGLWIVKGMLVKSGGSIRCRSRVATTDGGRSGTIMMVFVPSEVEAADQQTAA
ncbi:MAG TPA: PAS domain S-box protein [Acidobacteriaceae bacterium]|jgi:PAS domain S-box-containing protein|nr:PAS domain S-box protein [Acidobacteriaceae bacterium]